MKRIIQLLVVMLCLLCAGLAVQAQGKYAGSMQSLIGKTYTDSRAIEGLKGWQSREGSIISPIDVPEMIAVEVFQKGMDYVLFFSVMEDTAARVFSIVDVIEVNKVSNSWVIKAALCRQNEIENMEIVALVKYAKKPYMTNVKKAWRFNRDKRRAEAISVKGIDCINEGFGE